MYVYIYICIYVCMRIQVHMGFPGVLNGKESACHAGDQGSIPGLRRSPGEGNGNPLQYLAWRIPWAEEPCWLQSMGSQRVRHDRATSTFTFTSYRGINCFSFEIKLSTAHVKRSLKKKKKKVRKEICRKVKKSKWLVNQCLPGHAKIMKHGGSNRPY